MTQLLLKVFDNQKLHVDKPASLSELREIQQQPASTSPPPLGHQDPLCDWLHRIVSSLIGWILGRDSTIDMAEPEKFFWKIIDMSVYTVMI